MLAVVNYTQPEFIKRMIKFAPLIKNVNGRKDDSKTLKFQIIKFENKCKDSKARILFQQAKEKAEAGSSFDNVLDTVNKAISNEVVFCQMAVSKMEKSSEYTQNTNTNSSNTRRCHVHYMKMKDALTNADTKCSSNEDVITAYKKINEYHNALESYNKCMQKFTFSGSSSIIDFFKSAVKWLSGIAVTSVFDAATFLYKVGHFLIKVVGRVISRVLTIIIKGVAAIFKVPFDIAAYALNMTAREFAVTSNMLGNLPLVVWNFISFSAKVFANNIVPVAIASLGVYAVEAQLDFYPTETEQESALNAVRQRVISNESIRLDNEKEPIDKIPKMAKKLTEMTEAENCWFDEDDFRDTKLTGKGQAKMLLKGVDEIAKGDTCSQK